MGDTAVTAQVEIPLIVLLRQAVVLDPGQQPIEVLLAGGAADDLAKTLRGQQVDPRACKRP